MNSVSGQLFWLMAYVIPVVFAISLHEAAHGYVARFFGDSTAADEGRVSINPLRHIDPLGTILLPLVAYWLIQLPFGYAKPVPVDFNRLGNPRRDAAFVAFAGPAANAAMGTLWALLGLFVSVRQPLLWEMARAGILVNAAMVVFNMIPVPPLDGGEILMSLLPRRIATKMEAIRLPPARPKKTIRLLRRLMPYWLLRRTVRMEVYDMCIFAMFLLLMKFHVLDRFLARSIYYVSNAFKAVVIPFS
ncbi:site-2 protease family protein [Massilia sp. TSP1-1-2]|uniref:site-2 protease family protein n=1 Tax=Massilia sp. TSP1-1-2 TaxID=2804649 RepID=UPI003CE9D27B